MYPKGHPNYTKSGKPHGGRIAYPRAYYRIMSNKYINKELKKVILKEYRDEYQKNLCVQVDKTI